MTYVAVSLLSVSIDSMLGELQGREFVDRSSVLDPTENGELLRKSRRIRVSYQ